MFVLARRKRVKVTTGTGIGLALSRSLAELHCGFGYGSGRRENLFRLTLPTTQDMVIALDSDMENKDAGLQVETSGESYLDDKLEEKHSKESKLWFWL